MAATMQVLLRCSDERTLEPLILDSVFTMLTQYAAHDSDGQTGRIAGTTQTCQPNAQLQGFILDFRRLQ